MSRPSLWCACSVSYANPLLLQTESEHCSETQSCCVSSQALSRWVCSVITHKIQVSHNLCSIFQYIIPTGRKLPQTKTYLAEDITSTMKLKFYFYFQLTEHFFRKLRDHLAETNSWSFPQGTKRDSSGLQSTLKLRVKGLAVTETAALTEVTSWHKPWSSAPHTATCQERLHRDFLMGKELKQCWGRDKHLEGGASCSSRRPEQLFLLMDQSQTKMFFLSGPDHKPLDCDFRDTR